MFNIIKKFLFVNTSTKQTVIKNTFWLIFGETISRLLRFFVVIYAARTLGTNGWGIFSYALSIGGLLMILADLGLSGFVTRELSKSKEGLNTLVSTAVFIKIIVLSISVVVVIFCGPLISKLDGARQLIPLVAFILLFDSLRELGFAFNRAFEKMEYETLAKIIAGVAMLGAGLILFNKNTTPHTITIVYFIGSLMGTVAIIWMLRKKIHFSFSAVRFSLIRKIIVITFPFAFVSLLVSIITNIDTYMLGIWRTSAEIGIYSAAQRLYQFPLAIPALLSMAMFPMLARFSISESTKLKNVLEKTLSAIILLAIPIAFGGVILAKKIVIIFLGIEYLRAASVLQILMITTLITFPSIILSSAIFAVNEQKIFFKASGIGALINILLNLFLIPLWGAIGAAISTFFALAITTIFMWKRIKKVSNLSLLDKLKKPLLAGVIMLLISFFLETKQFNFILNIIISAFTYLFSLYIMKDNTLKDIILLIQSK